MQGSIKLHDRSSSTRLSSLRHSRHHREGSGKSGAHQVAPSVGPRAKSRCLNLDPRLIFIDPVFYTSRHDVSKFEEDVSLKSIPLHRFTAYQLLPGCKMRNSDRRSKKRKSNSTHICYLYDHAYEGCTMSTKDYTVLLWSGNRRHFLGDSPAFNEKRARLYRAKSQKQKIEMKTKEQNRSGVVRVSPGVKSRRSVGLTSKRFVKDKEFSRGSDQPRWAPTLRPPKYPFRPNRRAPDQKGSDQFQVTGFKAFRQTLRPQHQTNEITHNFMRQQQK
ncbi:hypothetical protein LXL04_024992 [Taraxacum kok-saghyz]